MAALAVLGCKKKSAPHPPIEPRTQDMALVLASDAAPVSGATRALDAAPHQRMWAEKNPEKNAEKNRDLVDLQSLMPDLRLDMRYAGTNNFVGKVLYRKARCLLRRPVALALQEVQALLALEGLQVLLWDCYRPFSVQELLWRHVPDRRFVAKPVRKRGQLAQGSKHNRGAAVDLSLLTLDGAPLPMPTDHDDFSPRAHQDAQGVSALALANAQRLQRAMESAGFQGINTEWWHFDHQSWRTFELSDEPL